VSTHTLVDAGTTLGVAAEASPVPPPVWVILLLIVQPAINTTNAKTVEKHIKAGKPRLLFFIVSDLIAS
jgi:hypothetical protein